jgi:hypothetical protein
MARILSLYLIATRRNRYVLFCPTDLLEAVEAESHDRVRQFLGWFTRRRNRVIAWMGRVMQVGHAYYERLEDRIDPMERVLKAVAHASHLEVHFAPSRTGVDPRSHFEAILRNQRRKHIFWILADTVVCVVIAAFTPVLMPIPGPNVFFYYPFLRWLSHYRALQGARSALRLGTIEYKSLPDLAGLEENLQSRFDRKAVRSLAERLKIQGLDRFLERIQ